MSAQATADTSVSALRGLLGGLRAIEGPKNLVLVSQGLVTGGSADPGANRRLDVVADDFARARTSLYTIHIDRTIADATDTAERLASDTRLDDKSLYLDGLEAIAGYTGGPLLRAQTTVDFAFERVALETSAGWLLSFEPEGSDRDGKPHDIRVKVARDGIELRARPRFVVDAKQTAPRSSEARARQSLDALLPDADVPLAVTTLALNGTAGDIRLMVAVEVGLDSAEDTALGQRLVDSQGALVKGTITTGVLEPVRAPGGRALYGLVIIPVKPGTYTLKLAVATPTGRAGSIERLIDVRLRPAGPLLLSDLMVADTGRRESGLMVNVDGRLLGRDASVLLEVSGAATQPTVQFELVRAGESSAELMANARLRARDGAGRFDATAVLGLGGLAAGSYELRALVLQDGQEVGRAVRTVELLPELAGTADPPPVDVARP